MSNQKGNALVVLLTIIVVLAAIGGAYYLGTQKNSTPLQTYQQQTLPTVTPTSTQTPSSQANIIPADWTYQKSTACNVSFPIPPKEEPYFTTSLPSTNTTNDNNRFWKMLQNTESEMFLFKDDSMLIYSPIKEEALGNDYNPGFVSVFCTQNSEPISNDQLITKLEANIENNNDDFKLLNKRKVEKWNIDTVVVNIQGGMFEESDVYLFNIGKRSYFATYTSQSDNQIVKDTTKRIFDNLQFSE